MACCENVLGVERSLVGWMEVGMSGLSISRFIMI